MQEQLKNFINELKSAKGLSAYDEAQTKQIIIMRVLNILGWNMFNIDEIQPEFPVDSQNSNEKVDYALARNTDNMVFVEAKSVKTDLDDWEEKFGAYCYKYNVVLGVLTNGISWRFWLPRAKGSWYERKFYTIDIYQQDIDTIVTRFTDFLLKENVVTGKSEENAKKTFELKQKSQIIKKSLPKAWNTLLSSEDESFMDLFNDMLEKISGYRAEPEEIAEFIEKNKSNLLIFEEQTQQILRKTRDFGYTAPHEEERISDYTRTGFTGKNIKTFIFNNKRYDVKNWKQLLLILCEEVYNLNKTNFDNVLSLRGTKRTYFAKNPGGMREPRKIKGTEIFVETHWNANKIVNMCEDVLSLFGYKEGLKIETD